jgi:hypothetical protein
MAKTKEKEQPKPQVPEVDTKINSAVADEITNQVLQKLGTPPNFSHVNAINLFDNRWRVNVYDKSPGFIEKKRIVASFYCLVDEHNSIVSPSITKIFS